MKTTARLTFEKVRFDRPKDAHLVVSIAAPPGDPRGARAPVCVIPVLDVSGSMQGEKLHYAKQSILKLVDHLAPGDFCGVVVFAGRVETLAAPAELTQARKDALKAAVEQLGARDNTNLGGGLLAGLDHARVTVVPEGMLVRVILFTDGLANQGPATTPAELRDLLEANLGSATVSAFGYGDDADQELLRELSTLGGGNYAYVRNPEDALTAFARELGGLLSTYAHAIQVRVTPCEGAELTDVVSDVDARDERGSALLRVPDLLADEVRHLVLGVRLAPRPVPLDAPVAVAEVELSFQRLEGGRLLTERLACKAMVRFVAEADAQASPAPELDEIVAIAQLVRAQIEAEEAARQGRHAEARDVMVLFQAAVVARGHDAVGAAAGKLADKVGDRETYDRSTAYRSSMRKGSSRSVSSLYDAAAEQDLRSMGRAQRTVAQERMETSFGATPGAPERTAGARPGRLARRHSGRW